ncbi:unnamed protein product [Amoebophrya sp. A25]|nr:unnamed protein product [Amoebophrya sp. A25]|eukprot:GSA25T00015747001.1
MQMEEEIAFLEQLHVGQLQPPQRQHLRGASTATDPSVSEHASLPPGRTTARTIYDRLMEDSVAKAAMSVVDEKLTKEEEQNPSPAILHQLRLSALRLQRQRWAAISPNLLPGEHPLLPEEIITLNFVNGASLLSGPSERVIRQPPRQSIQKRDFVKQPDGTLRESSGGLGSWLRMSASDGDALRKAKTADISVELSYPKGEWVLQKTLESPARVYNTPAPSRLPAFLSSASRGSLPRALVQEAKIDQFRIRHVGGSHLSNHAWQKHTELVVHDTSLLEVAYVLVYEAEYDFPLEALTLYPTQSAAYSPGATAEAPRDNEDPFGVALADPQTCAASSEAAFAFARNIRHSPPSTPEERIYSINADEHLQVIHNGDEDLEGEGLEVEHASRSGFRQRIGGFFSTPFTSAQAFLEKSVCFVTPGPNYAFEADVPVCCCCDYRPAAPRRTVVWTDAQWHVVTEDEAPPEDNCDGCSCFGPEDHPCAWCTCPRIVTGCCLCYVRRPIARSVRCCMSCLACTTSCADWRACMRKECESNTQACRQLSSSLLGRGSRASRGPPNPVTSCCSVVNPSFSDSVSSDADSCSYDRLRTCSHQGSEVEHQHSLFGTPRSQRAEATGSSPPSTLTRGRRSRNRAARFHRASCWVGCGVWQPTCCCVHTFCYCCSPDFILDINADIMTIGSRVAIVPVAAQPYLLRFLNQLEAVPNGPLKKQDTDALLRERRRVKQEQMEKAKEAAAANAGESNMAQKILVDPVLSLTRNFERLDISACYLRRYPHEKPLLDKEESGVLNFCATSVLQGTPEGYRRRRLSGKEEGGHPDAGRLLLEKNNRLSSQRSTPAAGGSSIFNTKESTAPAPRPDEDGHYQGIKSEAPQEQVVLNLKNIDNDSSTAKEHPEVGATEYAEHMSIWTPSCKVTNCHPDSPAFIRSESASTPCMCCFTSCTQMLAQCLMCLRAGEASAYTLGLETRWVPAKLEQPGPGVWLEDVA